MNLGIKFGAALIATVQAMSSFSQTQNSEPKKVDVETADVTKYLVSCTGRLADVRTEVFTEYAPKYKNAETQAAYEYFFELGQKKAGVLPFFRMVADHQTPLMSEFIKAQVYKKEFPSYEVDYLTLGALISVGAEQCLTTYRKTQSRNPK